MTSCVTSLWKWFYYSTHWGEHEKLKSIDERPTCYQHSTLLYFIAPQCVQNSSDYLIDYFNRRNSAYYNYNVWFVGEQKRYSLESRSLPNERVMSEDVPTALSPLLMMNYVLGLRMTESPAHQSRLCLLYMLVIWLIYCFALMYTQMFYYTDEYRILMLSSVITLISTAVEVYQHQVGRTWSFEHWSCMHLFLRVLEIQKLSEEASYTRRHVNKARNDNGLRAYTQENNVARLGWFLISVMLIYGQFLCFKEQYRVGIATAIYVVFMLNYSFNVSFIRDLIITSVLEWVYFFLQERLSSRSRMLTWCINKERKISEN